MAEADFIADELAKLADLRDRGVLSEEEFASEKARLLSFQPSDVAPQGTIKGDMSSEGADDPFAWVRDSTQEQRCHAVTPGASVRKPLPTYAEPTRSSRWTIFWISLVAVVVAVATAFGVPGIRRSLIGSSSHPTSGGNTASGTTGSSGDYLASRSANNAGDYVVCLDAQNLARSGYAENSYIGLVDGVNRDTDKLASTFSGEIKSGGPAGYYDTVANNILQTCVSNGFSPS